MVREGLSGKNTYLTHVSGLLENEHVVGVQTQGPVFFTLHKQVLGNENDGNFLGFPLPEVAEVRSTDSRLMGKPTLFALAPLGTAIVTNVVLKPHAEACCLCLSYSIVTIASLCWKIVAIPDLTGRRHLRSITVSKHVAMVPQRRALVLRSDSRTFFFFLSTCV